MQAFKKFCHPSCLTQQLWVPGFSPEFRTESRSSISGWVVLLMFVGAGQCDELNIRKEDQSPH